MVQHRGKMTTRDGETIWGCGRKVCRDCAMAAFLKMESLRRQMA